MRCPITRSCARQANAIKKHAIENLDYYLEEFERNVEARGGKVVYCQGRHRGRRFRARRWPRSAARG